MKISIKETEVSYMPFQKSKPVYAAAKRQCTAAGQEVQVPWSGIHKLRKEIDTRIGKTNAVLRELIALWLLHNGSFRTPQSCQILNWS